MAELFVLDGARHGALSKTKAVRHISGFARTKRTGPVWAVDRDGVVAVIQLAPTPALLWCFNGAATLKATLQSLADDPTVGAIVLHGTAVFGDVSVDFAEAASVIEAVVECPIPIFAALEGPALGLGLELALACAGRVATAFSEFALPAVLSGRLPLHGGVPRLQALVGPDAAAELIVFGEKIDAAAALRVGLIDGMVARCAVTLAVALAQRSDAMPLQPQRPLSLSSSGDLASVRYQINSRAPGQAAPLAAVQAMEAALRLPLRRSTTEITAIAARLGATDQACALQHACASEKASHRRGAVNGASSSELAMQMGWPMRREAIHLLDEGASPAQIDRRLVDYGFSQGPFSLADHLGLAAVFSQNGQVIASDRAWPVYSPTLDFMIDAGRAGGSQPGWYRRREGETVRFDPDVERILIASALFRRLPRRRKSDEEVDQRLFQAMIFGSLALLSARPELSWLEVDALWVSELDFPRWRGGPLFQGAKLGWGEVCAMFEATECGRTMGPIPDRLKQWKAGTLTPPHVEYKDRYSKAG